MFIRIEKASSVPISRQIADQVRAQVMAGTAQPGHKMPSIRELARELAVNQNTILRVYERLTAEGLLEKRHGDGTYVGSKPTAAAQLRHQRQQLNDELAQLVRRALMLGLDAKALHELLENAIQSQTAAPSAAESTETTP